MNIINKIQEKLKKYPNVHYEVDDKTIKIPTQNNVEFEVSLSILHSGFVLNFDGWHEEFEKEEEVLDWFFFGLSEYCRLKIISRGKTDYKWIVERRDATGWKFQILTCILLFPFWLKKNERYLQNKIINT